MALVTTHENLFLCFDVEWNSVTAAAEVEAIPDSDAPARHESQREGDLHLFERCTLAIKHKGESKTLRKAFQLTSKNDAATIYDVEIENVKARIIHNSGKLAEYKSSQTLKFEVDHQRHQEGKKSHERLMASELESRRQRLNEAIKIKESELRNLDSAFKDKSEVPTPNPTLLT